MREDGDDLKVAVVKLRPCQQPLKPKEGEEEEEEELATLVSEAAEIVNAMGKAAAAAFRKLLSTFHKAVWETLVFVGLRYVLFADGTCAVRRCGAWAVVGATNAQSSASTLSS